MDTTDLDPDPRRLRLARNLRRVGLALMSALLALGLAGVFDPGEAEVSASAAETKLDVTHPDQTRAGFESALELRVERAGGFSDPVEIAISKEWLDLFDLNSIRPEPDSASADGERLLLSFEPPPGELLEATLDLTLRPAVRRTQPATVSVIEGGAPLVSVDFETAVVP